MLGSVTAVFVQKNLLNQTYETRPIMVDTLLMVSFPVPTHYIPSLKSSAKK